MWSIFCTIKRSWSQHFVEQFSAFIILLMSYTALLFIALALTNVQNMFEMWGQVNQVTVYLDPGIKQQDKTDIMKSLDGNPMVNSYQEVSSSESAKNFEKRFSKVTSQKIDAKEVAQFFPSYFIVNLNQAMAYSSGGTALDDFALQLKNGFEAIKNVSYGKSWLRRYVGVLSAIHWIGWFLIFSFLIASVIVSSSVIKTILFSRRDEIEILEFVGADDATIYLPQILNTMILASVAFISALGVNYGIYRQLKSSSVSMIDTSIQNQLTFIAPGLFLLIALLAIVSVAIYSVMTIFNLLPRRKKALLVSEVIR